MATYENQVLGAADASGGKDYILQYGNLGAVDLYIEPLVGGVDYVISAFGAASGQTLPDPAIIIFDSSFQPIDFETDGIGIGATRRDPMTFFTPPGIGVGQQSNYYIGVVDQTLSGGQYTLSVEQAGIPF